MMFARAASRIASVSRTRVASSTARGLSVSFALFRWIHSFRREKEKRLSASIGDFLTSIRRLSNSSPNIVTVAAVRIILRTPQTAN